MTRRDRTDMQPSRKLTDGEKHVLRLIRNEADEGGWTRVSKQVMPLVRSMPDALVEITDFDGGGLVRLKPLGVNLLDAMEWL